MKESNSWMHEIYITYSGSILLDNLEDKKNFLKNFPDVFTPKINCDRFRVCYGSEYENSEFISLNKEYYLPETDRIAQYKGYVRIDFPFKTEGDCEHYITIIFDKLCQFYITIYFKDKSLREKKEIERIEWLESVFNIKIECIEGYDVDWAIKYSGK
jgi:hypothetical protein